MYKLISLRKYLAFFFDAKVWDKWAKITWFHTLWKMFNLFIFCCFSPIQTLGSKFFSIFEEHLIYLSAFFHPFLMFPSNRKCFLRFQVLQSLCNLKHLKLSLIFYNPHYFTSLLAYSSKFLLHTTIFMASWRMCSLANFT